jgi:PAS domain-containing protein
MVGPNTIEFLLAIMDAIPSPLFVVDADVKIAGFNAAGAGMVGENPALTIRRRGGEALHCINATASAGGCGASEACKTCVVRNSVRQSCLQGSVERHPLRMRLVGPNGEREAYLLITTSPLAGSNPPQAALLFEDIGELVSLEGLVPVCMHCRRVRTEGRTWQAMERYLKDHLDMDISHGLCPDCLRKYYPEFADEIIVGPSALPGY